jgi:L-asparaginase/Glu-tRNA(Gln) amidotransferase subunit D
MVCWRRTMLNIATAVMLRDLIEAAVKNGARGIVVAGVGDGNMTPPTLNELTKAAKNGIAVVRSTHWTVRYPEPYACYWSASHTTGRH